MKKMLLTLAACIAISMAAGCDEDGQCHGGSGGGGGSDTPITTPLPGSIVLVGIGTALVGWIRRVK